MGGRTGKFSAARFAACRDFMPMLGSFFALFFGLFFDAFFDRFWSRFESYLGRIWGAKIVPNRPKFGPRRLLKRYFLQKMNFHEISVKPMRNQQKWPQDRSQNGLRSLQNGSGAVLKRCFFRIDFCLRFWSVLGPILAPFGELFGSLLEVQNRHKK